MDIHLLSPVDADMMVWTAAGLISLILLTKKFGWAPIVSSLIVAELTMIGFIVPSLMLRNWPIGAYRPTAYAVGFGGTLILGAVVNFLEKFREDPEGTASRLWGLWKGQSSGGER